MRSIKLSALRAVLYEVAINGLGVLVRTRNDFSLWRMIEYPKMTEYLEVQRGSWVLDLGAGTSSYPLMLTREGVNVVVLDLAVDRAEWQQAKAAQSPAGAGELRVVVADAAHLPLRDAVFDRVAAVSAIEHMEDDRSVGAEICRVLSVGGLAAISVPYTRSGRREFFAGIKPFKLVRPNEFVQEGKGMLFRFYTDADLEERFGQNGACRITKRSFFGRKILNGWYHETRLNRYWRSFILKDWLLTVLVHPFEERFLQDQEPFDIMFQLERVR